MKTIVVGAGYWGINYIKELGGNCVGVVDADKERCNYIFNNYNLCTYPNLDSVANSDYDAAIICTPPSSHVELAFPILKSGRYCLIEKPIASNMEEAMKLYPYRKRCMAGMLYLFNPGIYALKAEVLSMGGSYDHMFFRRTAAGPIRPWDNAIWDLAPHDIAIANYIHEMMPIDVRSTYSDNWGIIHLEYAVDKNVIIYVSWMGGPKTRTIEIASRSPLADRFIFDDVKTIHEISPLKRMLNSFHSGKWNVCTYDQGLDVLRVLQLIEES